MDVLEAIHTRRSVRRFTPEPVPEPLLEQVLQAGAASASGGNVQPWAFVLVRSPQRLAGLRALAPGIIGQPAAVIAICYDAERAARLGGRGSGEMARLDIGLATQNMLLAAHGLGLGACPIGSFHPQGVAIFLDLPAGVEPILLIALGYPAVRPQPPGRRRLAEVCFSEVWSRPDGDE
jgi:nitroreductase